MWPPFLEVMEMSSSRISCASCGSCWAVSAFTSAGPRIASRTRGVGEEDESFIDECGMNQNSVFPAGFKLFEAQRAVFLFLQLLDFQLGVLQTGLAELQEFGTFLEFRQQFGERHFAG